MEHLTRFECGDRFLTNFQTQVSLAFRRVESVALVAMIRQRQRRSPSIPIQRDNTARVDSSSLAKLNQKLDARPIHLHPMHHLAIVERRLASADRVLALTQHG